MDVERACQRKRSVQKAKHIKRKRTRRAVKGKNK